MTEREFAYDEVPYPSYTFPQTHPDRLSTLGRLAGIDTALPDNCRVLEIGCGDGTNLVSFAYALPNSHFVGIDLSEVHIEKARATATYLGIENTQFVQADVTAIDCGQFGEFDFIIAHGLFSWVPEHVRPHILRVFSECLAPNGVGYLSYNAYPGCHLREISSGIMKTHTDAISDPREKVEHGIAFLSHVCDAAEEDSLYQMMLRWEITHMIDRSPENVFHDDLSSFNQPFYFNEVNSMLEENSLRYFSEADPTSSNPARLSAKAQELLKLCGSDLARREQMIDLITCRRFRASLFGRSGSLPFSPFRSTSIRAFRLSSSLTTDLGERHPFNGGPVTFVGTTGTSVSIDHVPTIAAILHLIEISSQNIAFERLMIETAKDLGTQELSSNEIQRTENILLQFYFAGMIDLHRASSTFTSEISERPKASAFARWQMINGSSYATTLTGRNLKAESDAVRNLLTLLDGSNDRSELVSRLSKLIEVIDESPENAETRISQFVDEQLRIFADAGLIVG